MLEVLFLKFVRKKIDSILASRGYDKKTINKYVAMTILFWFAAEIICFILGIINLGFNDDSMIVIYLFSIIGAFASLGVSFIIINGLPVKDPESDYNSDNKMKLVKNSNNDY